ncbi:hypothetical protein MHOL44478_13370 [Mycobacterium holsaticum DSM 44478]|nr:hypothetical protein [Mycolicibacterium holsaticum DSM 44478 = JCM 12374]
MPGRLQSGLLAAVTAVGVVAPTAVIPAEPAVATPRTEVHDVRLAATAPPLGAIPLAFIGNQLQYCSLICPHVVDGLITVPIALAITPVTFLGALGATGSPLRALGAAAASVTGPANAAATGIIENDVFRVVPKAFNNLEVTVVELFDVASAALRPGDLLHEVDAARTSILAALNQPLPPPAPTETGARTLPQVLAVETIRVLAAIAFQAGEILLLGTVQAVDTAAQELAVSGDPSAAIAAGTAQAADAVAVAAGIVGDAAKTAVTNVRAAVADPFARTASTLRPGPAELPAAEPASEPATTQTSRPAATSDTHHTQLHRPKLGRFAQIPKRAADLGRHHDAPAASDQLSSADSSVSPAGRSARSGAWSGRSDGPDSTDDGSSRDSATPSAAKNTTNNDPPR